MASSGTWGTGPCVPEGSGGGGAGCFFTLCTLGAVFCVVCVSSGFVVFWVVCVSSAGVVFCVVCVSSARDAIGRHSAPATSNPVSFNATLMTTTPDSDVWIRFPVFNSNSSTAAGCRQIRDYRYAVTLLYRTY